MELQNISEFFTICWRKRLHLITKVVRGTGQHACAQCCKHCNCDHIPLFSPKSDPLDPRNIILSRPNHANQLEHVQVIMQ